MKDDLSKLPPAKKAGKNPQLRVLKKQKAQEALNSLNAANERVRREVGDNNTNQYR